MRLTTKFALFTSAVFISVSAYGFFPGDSISGDSYEDCQAKLSSYIAEWSNPSSYCGGNYYCQIKQWYGPTHYSIDMIADPNIPGLRGYERLLNCAYPLKMSLGGLTVPSAVQGEGGVLIVPSNQSFTVNIRVKAVGINSGSRGTYRLHLQPVKSVSNQPPIYQDLYKDVPYSALANGDATIPFEVTLSSEFLGNMKFHVSIENDIYDFDKSDNVADYFYTVGVSTAAPEVSIFSVDFAQVVYNPQSIAGGIFDNQWSPLIVAPSYSFTAVADKSASFRATVSLQNAGATVLPGKYQLQILSGNTVVSQSPQLDYSTLSSGSYTISPELMVPPAPVPSFIPKVLGVNSLRAVVVNGDSRIRNDEKNLTLKVLKTYNPAIGLAKVMSGDTTQYFSTNETSFNRFMQLSPYLSSIFPVADKSINLIPMGSVLGNPFSGGAKTNDLQALSLRRRLLQLNRSAGIVSQRYFKFVGEEEDVVGYHRRGTLSKEMIVSEDYLRVLPHELAHSFGVQYEMYRSNIPNRVFNGYNADPVPYPGSIKLISSKGSIMDSAKLSDSVLDMPWIDERSYSITFNFLQKPIVDPKTILVAGTLHKNGLLENLKTYDIPNGVLTDTNLGGDVEFRTLDINGNIVF